MKKILLIPLDERPCNLLFPQAMAKVRNDLELIVPPTFMLGQKKKPANQEQLWDFIEKHIPACDVAILSIEMLFYGGLLPSRLHCFDPEKSEILINKLRRLKENNKNTRLYLFQLIMRTPRYNSSDEEPDYYEEFGERIFKNGYFIDKKNRVGLSDLETKEFAQIAQEVPIKYLNDYEQRRNFNLEVNKLVIELIKEGLVDLLCIPQDDSCEYGYTAMDQEIIGTLIKKHRLQNRVLMYPGADEAGCTLLARAMSDMNEFHIKMYPFYSSTLGPTIIPLYEDRIMMESLKSHLMAAGVTLTFNKEEADFVLAINSPGKVMEESFNQHKKDITYTSYRNLNYFVSELKAILNVGKKVLLADCAFSNGGDLELLDLLDEYKILDQLTSYKGWNTHCNTLGTTIAQGVLAYDININESQRKINLLTHLIDDGIYQSLIRQEKYKTVQEEEGALLDYFYKISQNSFKDIDSLLIKVIHPWNRMFEIDLTVDASFL